MSAASRRTRATAVGMHALAWVVPMGMVFGCGMAADDQQGAVAKEQCTAPSGHFGSGVGDIAPTVLSWQGSTEQGNESTISIDNFYDCDGSRGINALLVDQSAAWCDVCQALARKIAEHMHESWRARGIHVLTLLTESADASPATLETALAWKAQFGLQGTTVAADPTRSFRNNVDEQLAPYPYEIVIDPRTMQIVGVEAGFDGNGDFPTLVGLAEANAQRGVVAGGPGATGE